MRAGAARHVMPRILSNRRLNIVLVYLAAATAISECALYLQWPQYSRNAVNLYIHETTIFRIYTSRIG